MICTEVKPGRRAAVSKGDKAENRKPWADVGWGASWVYDVAATELSFEEIGNAMGAMNCGKTMPGRMLAVFAVGMVVLMGQRVDAQKLEAARVKIEPPVTSLGVLLPGEIKKSTFEIVNTGSETVKLYKMKPSCPCMTLRTDTDLIPAGGRLTVTVDVEATWEPHKPVKKNVQLFFEGYEIATNTAMAFAVDRGVRADQFRINLDKRPEGKIRLVSKDEQPFRVLSVDGKEPDYPGGFDDQKHDIRKNYNVTYNFSGREAGETPMHLLIETDHPDAPILAIPLYSSQLTTMRDQWQIGPIRSLRRQTVLGVIPAGRVIDFEFPMHCGADSFDLQATSLKEDLVWVDIVSKVQTSAGKWKVKARLTMMDQQFRGMFDETIVLRAGANLQTSFQVIARVEDTVVGKAGQGDG